MYDLSNYRREESEITPAQREFARQQKKHQQSCQKAHTNRKKKKRSKNGQ